MTQYVSRENFLPIIDTQIYYIYKYSSSSTLPASFLNVLFVSVNATRFSYRKINSVIKN